MSKAAEGSPCGPHKQGPLARMLLWPVGLAYRLWIRSVRFENILCEETESVVPRDQACILFLWHNRLFLAGEWQRRFRGIRNCYGLISASKDGALLETFYGWAGIRAVRGSKNRRGTQAIRELVRVMRSNNDIGITPDGSRGPRYEAKQGALLVAKLTKAPLLLLSFEYSYSIKLKSWDKFVIPFPFSKVVAHVRYLCYEELFSGNDLEEATKLAQDKLLNITKD